MKHLLCTLFLLFFCVKSFAQLSLNFSTQADAYFRNYVHRQFIEEFWRFTGLSLPVFDIEAFDKVYNKRYLAEFSHILNYSLSIEHTENSAEYIWLREHGQPFIDALTERMRNFGDISIYLAHYPHDLSTAKGKAIYSLINKLRYIYSEMTLMRSSFVRSLITLRQADLDLFINSHVKNSQSIAPALKKTVAISLASLEERGELYGEQIYFCAAKTDFNGLSIHGQKHTLEKIILKIRNQPTTFNFINETFISSCNDFFCRPEPAMQTTIDNIAFLSRQESFKNASLIQLLKSAPSWEDYTTAQYFAVSLAQPFEHIVSVKVWQDPQMRRYFYAEVEG